MEPVGVRHASDSVALARVQRVLAPFGISTIVVAAFLLGALQLATGGLALYRGGAVLLAYVQIAFGLAYGPMIFFVYRRLALVVPEVDGRMTIDDAGLTLEPSGESVPWQRIEPVRDVGEAFMFRRTGRGIALFTYDVPDEGRALWNDLEDLLVAKSLLVPGTSSRTTIANTALR